MLALTSHGLQPWLIMCLLMERCRSVLCLQIVPKRWVMNAGALRRDMYLIRCGTYKKPLDGKRVVNGAFG